MADGAVAAAGTGTGTAAQSAQTTEATQSAPETSTAENTKNESAEQSPKVEHTGKKRLLERYAKQYPDRKFEGDGADDDLYDLTADEFDKYDNESKSYRERNDRLNKLFDEFPDSAEIFKAMALDKKHPFDYIIDNYHDLLDDGLSSEENRARIKQRRAENEQKAKANKEADDKFHNNMAQSLKILTEWGGKKGIDLKGQAEHYARLRKVVNDFADGNISEDTYEALWNGLNYKNDVAQAKEQGEINGRNAKIQAEFQQSRSRRNMPPTLGGQGLGSEEYDQDKGDGIYGMFGIPIKKKK